MLWYNLQHDPSLCIREHPIQGMVQLMNDRLWEEWSIGIPRKVGIPTAGLYWVRWYWSEWIKSTGNTNYITFLVSLESPLFLQLCMLHVSSGNSQGCLPWWGTTPCRRGAAVPLISAEVLTREQKKNKINEKRWLSVVLQGKMSLWNVLLCLNSDEGEAEEEAEARTCTTSFSLLGSPQQCCCGVAF